MAAEEGEEAVCCLLLVGTFCAFGNQLLCISQILRGQLPLHTDEAFHQWLILFELLVVALWHWARDDERRAGIIDKD